MPEFSPLTFIPIPSSRQEPPVVTVPSNSPVATLVTEKIFPYAFLNSEEAISMFFTTFFKV